MAGHTARLLGAAFLTDADGVRVESLLAQPKRFAVLAYLAVEGRTAPVSRDKVAALFWPELDQARARQALRQSLHVLRRELGDDAIVGVGTEFVALGGKVTTDVAAFEAAIGAARFDEAAAVYRGAFLDGFHLGDAPGFDEWMEGRRAHFRGEAVEALAALASAAERSGDLDAAARWTRAELALAGVDEGPLRRLMRLLERQGNGAAAVAAYDDYAAWLHREMEMNPSDESAALAARLRSEAASAGPPEPRARTPFGSADPVRAPSGLPSPPAVAPASARRDSPRFLTPLAFAVTVVVAVVAAVLVGGRSGTGEPADPAPAVAVLPFLDLSQAGDQQYLTDGVTEEIITSLSKVRGLRVTARTSSFAYRDAREDVPRIARELRVTSVLEGSVRREGNRLRITAQLIDAKTGYHIWSDNFDRDVADVIGVQEEISRAIAKALRVELVGPDASTAVVARPGRGAAYELYLRGRFYWNQRGAEGIRKSIDFFRQAVSADPDYAPAVAGLASALQFAPTFELMRPADAFPQAEAAVRRAMVLDSTLAEARAVNGYIKLVWARDLDGAERELRQAIALAPAYATAHQWLRLVMVTRGRYDEAVDEAIRARELDPVSPSILAALGDTYLYAGRRKPAADAFNAALELNPQLTRALNGLAEIAVLDGRAADAVRIMERSVALSPGNTRNLAQLAFAVGRSGNTVRADSVVAVLRAISRTQYVPAYAFAVAHAGLQRADSTIAWLSQTVDEHDNWATVIPPGPEFQFVVRDARFGALVSRIRGAPAR